MDDDPEPDEEGAFGSAYTSILVYGPGLVSEGPLNVRLTHDAQTSRGLAWDAPRDPWLTTVRTARAGSGRQQVTLDPWVTGYRVERHEYRRTEDGGWVLQGDWETLRDETDGDTRTSFTDSEDKGEKQYVYRVWAHNDWGLTRYSFRGDWAFNGGDPGGDPETAEYIPPLPAQQQGGETPSNTPATGAPAISGTPLVGETLTADTSGIEDADGLDDVTYSYQWIRSDNGADTDIAGATDSTYTLVSADQGNTIQVRVTFTDDADNDETLTSAPTVEVAAKPNTAPTGLPTISGTAQVGETLTADTSGIADADGLTNVTFEYQWLAGGSDISGATSSSYTLTASEQGQTIQVRVSFTDDADNDESLTSEATVAVAAAPNRDATGAPTIGGTPQVDQTLTADTSPIDDADGMDNVSYSYQWLAGGSDISGATSSSYTLTASEQGQTIQVRVSFTDDADNDESLTSEATAEVTAPPVPLTVSVTVSAPATHDGSSEFTFEIEFSEEVKLSYVTLKNHAFNVTGGSVERAQRTDKPSNIPWLITVKPQGAGDVTIELPATTNCGDLGAICTKDDSGRMLSNSLSFTVSGPGQ